MKAEWEVHSGTMCEGETVGFHYGLQFNCLRWLVTICLEGGERSKPGARRSRTGHAAALHEVASGQRASSRR